MMSLVWSVVPEPTHFNLVAKASHTFQSCGAKVDGEVVARTRFIPLSTNHCHIIDLYVDPEYRRQSSATTSIELLMLEYRYFTCESINADMDKLFKKLYTRPDVTAWPRVAKYRDGKIYYKLPTGRFSTSPAKVK